MNKHNHQVHIMLYDSGRAVLTKLCEKGGLNMSALLRKRIMKTTPSIDWRPLTDRINALGGSSTRLPVPHMNTEPPQSMLSRSFPESFAAHVPNRSLAPYAQNKLKSRKVCK